MQVLLNLPVKNHQNGSICHQNIYPSPSFKMKMSELKGVDQFVARKYKINPQSIKTLAKFHEHCKELAAKINETNFFGRQKETKIQRKAMIEDWFKYITEENGAYTGAMALMIMSGITAGLKPNGDTLPPVLNKGVLANTITDVQNRLNQDEKSQLNFEKEYKLNLQKSIMTEEKALDGSLNGWIVIPSKEHDPENFGANVDKLKMLSHDNWCTKSFNAEPYLSEGDFHVYMEQGKPKLGVRFVGDEIEEVQGELNNSKIPVRYYNIATSYLKNYKLSNNAKDETNSLEETKKQVDEILKRFPEGINNYAAEEIFEHFGIKYKKNEDGFLTLSNYTSTCYKNLTYDDLGIDEERLFNNVKRIEGDADFTKSNFTNLGELVFIGGSAYFKNSKITSLGKLRAIGKNAYFCGSKVRDLGDLESIAGFYNFNWYDSDLRQECKNRIKDYDDSIVNKNILKNFPEGINNAPVEKILESFDIKYKKDDDGLLIISHYNANIGDIGINKLRFCDLGVDEDRLFKYIKKIEGDGIFNDSKVTHLGKLESIGGNARFNKQLANLGELRFIGGSAYFQDTQVQSLGELEYIGGNAWFMDSKIKNLGKLRYVGGEAVIVYPCELELSDFANVEVKKRITY